MLCDILYMEMMHLEINTGYLYHIKDEYFDVVDDDSLMQNHEKGKKDQLILLININSIYNIPLIYKKV